jgi:TusE/DsrC/DsvC family sulfur relay protein
MGISPEDFVETVEWIEEELQKELGDPTYKIPIDKPGTRYLMCLNPREVKFYPLLFRAQFLTCYAAGEEWGVSSRAWDATNYGLFSGDDAACKQIISHLMDEAERLGVHTIVATECGHGYRSLRWEAQGCYGKPLPVNVMSYVELTAQHIQEGRLKLDPSKNREPVTYHDPCNQARSGGIVDEPRYILNRTVSDFREMTPHGTENFCCGGGGGALTMSEFRERRLEVARIKAEQIKATGARIVATSCHNCIDQLTEISRHYKLGVKVVNICELVANALILPPKQVAVPAPEVVAPIAVAVDENGFIANPADWSRGAAQFLAARQGYGQALERLGADHWRVVEYIRSYYAQAGVAPSREQICGELHLTGKRFHELFPGTIRTALRIAGLPASAAGGEPVEESVVR